MGKVTSMNKMKLVVMVGVAAQLGLSAATASAQGWTAQALKVYAADPLDTARTLNGRLRKTRYEETQEMAVVKMFADLKTGVFVQMQSGSLNGTQPVHRQNLACTPIQLQQNADGTVGAAMNGTAKFITTNTGQDYRNANHPDIYPINGGQQMLVTFNYRPQGANNTSRWAIVVDNQCNLIPVQNSAGVVQKQVQIMAKNNDDCDMHQAGGAGEVFSDANGTTQIAYAAGCNGNGKDDFWLNAVEAKALNNATAFQITKLFDVDMDPNEERSRAVMTIGTDPTVGILTWTAGNNEPQRGGTWIGAVDLSSTGPMGANANSRLLWKKKIQDTTVYEGVKTYSVRAKSVRVLDATGAKTDQVIVQTGLLRGNNTNNQKGGRYLGMFMGVATATRTGLTWDVPMTDITNQMLGIDGTHLTATFALVQDGDKMVPAMTFLQGSQNGGGSAMADVKILGVDLAAQKFIDYGSHPAAATSDRGLYSNFLGGNPGNQAGNWHHGIFIKNPFAAAATDPQFLLMHALTGKDPNDVANPAIKLSSYLSIMPMVQPKTAAPPPPPGMPNMNAPGQNASGGGQNSEPQPGDPIPGNQPGNYSAGCSMATNVATSASGVFFLLVGLGFVTLARRRRA